MKARDYIANYLRQLGITHVFGVSGANIESVFQSCQEAGIETILAKHEAAAVNMAEGYFKASGNLGVVLATSGGGGFNTLSPLTEALASSIPILVIVGQVSLCQEGQGSFQDSSGIGTAVHAVNIFEAVSRRTAKLTSPHQCPEALSELVATAINERGPTVLLIPKDLQDGFISVTEMDRPEPLADAPTVNEPHAALEDLCTELESCTWPMIIAGPGILTQGYSQDFLALVRRLNCKVAVTPDAKGLMDHNSPHYAGVVGIMGHDTAFDLLQRSDLVLCVGTSLPAVVREPTCHYLTHKPVLYLHTEPPFVNEAMIDGLKLVRLAGEPKQNLQILIERLTANPNPLSPSSCKFRPSCPENGKMGMEEIIGHLAAAMSDDADVFADAGNCGASVIHYLPVSGRGVFSVALGMGAMGHSFGCAIGSAAYRRRETWVFAGDGAYFMHGWEIHTAWQYQLPIVFVIFDNSSHGMCVIREDIYLRQRTELNTFKPSRLGQGVAATWPQFPAWEVTSIEELQQALCELKAEPSGPKFLSIQVSATEIPPFLPFITANNN